MYKKSESYDKKFPTVMVLENLLGADEGTILKFDPFSGKYVSVVEEEEISDDYFYSGSAIAIDPYIVQDNIGVLFTHIDQAPSDTAEQEEKEFIEETNKMAEAKPVKTETNGQEPEQDYEYKKVHTLVVDCECGHRNFIDAIDAPGINVTLMAEDETSFIELHCKECGSNLKLWFAPSEELTKGTNEPTKEKSK
jgi:hypothetical protein